MSMVTRFFLLLASLGAVAVLPEFAPPKPPAYRDHSRLMVVRDAQGALAKVESLRDWNIRREHILAHVQEVMGPLPGGERRVPLDVRIEGTFEEDGYFRKKVTYASEPGDRVPAWLLVPKSVGGKKLPAMLCPHQTIAIGKDEPAGLGESRASRSAKSSPKGATSSCVPTIPTSASTRSMFTSWVTRAPR